MVTDNGTVVLEYSKILNISSLPFSDVFNLLIVTSFSHSKQDFGFDLYSFGSDYFLLMRSNY